MYFIVMFPLFLLFFSSNLLIFRNQDFSRDYISYKVIMNSFISLLASFNCYQTLDLQTCISNTFALIYNYKVTRNRYMLLNINKIENWIFLLLFTAKNLCSPPYFCTFYHNWLYMNSYILKIFWNFLKQTFKIFWFKRFYVFRSNTYICKMT